MGTQGFINTFHEFDLRPGGAWRLTMHGPDGVDYEMEKNFREVIPPERIVLDHRQPMHNFRMTMTFAETAGNTTLTWLMRFESGAVRMKTIITLIAAALMAGCASHRGHLPESASQSHPSNRRYHMSPNKLTVEKIHCT